MEAWGDFYYYRRIGEHAHYSLYQVVRPAAAVVDQPSWSLGDGRGA